MKKKIILLASISTIAIPVSYAQNGITELRELVQALRSEVQQLKSEVAQLKGGQEVPSGSSQDAPVASETSLTQAAKAPKQPVLKNNFFEIYGYVKADIFHDTSVLSHQDIPYWVRDGEAGDGATDATARQSRIGFHMRAPELIMGGELTGKIELDFFGNAPTPTSMSGGHAYGLRTRQVFLQWESENWKWLAGEAWDSYLLFNPDTLNFAYYNFQGQIGFRRMQFIGTRKLKLGNDRQLDIGFTLGEPLGGPHGADADGDFVDDGVDSEMPALAFRLDYKFKGVGGRSGSLGLSGFYLREEIGTSTYTGHAVIVGLDLPVTDWLTFKGIAWTGQNLDSAFSAIGQGINTTTDEEIEASGGWTQLRFQFSPKYWINLGYSLDDPKDGNLLDGQRSRNQSLLANVYVSIAPPLLLGFEWMYLVTDYKGDKDYSNNRFMGSLIYKF